MNAAILAGVTAAVGYWIVALRIHSTGETLLRALVGEWRMLSAVFVIWLMATFPGNADAIFGLWLGAYLASVLGRKVS